MLKNLPIGIHTFEKIVEGNYFYVDKTKDIYDLITKGSVYFYLVQDVLVNHY